MNAVEIHSEADRYIISIDKNAVDKAILTEFLERLQLEDLAQWVGLDDSMLELGEEINAAWWRANKGRFIRE